MSDYSRFKALRYPITGDDRDRIENMRDYMGAIQVRGCGYFDITCTDKRLYLDYILEHSYGDECGDWGKVRDINAFEQQGFRHLFAQFFPDIDMSKVKLVDYCWYNCCEPPDYYDVREDPFYETVLPKFCRWVDVSELADDSLLECSVCHSRFEDINTIKDLTHCPKCGSRTDKEILG